MRIGTWNVEYGIGVRNPERLALLREREADIWILTETDADLDLSGTHPHAMLTEPRSTPKTRKGSTWVTIWSKHPIVRALAVPDPRRMAGAVVETPHGDLAVIGVVLPWNTDAGDVATEPKPRGWDEHRRVVKHEVPALLSALREQAPGMHRIVAGDFNTDFHPPHSYGLQGTRQDLLHLLTEHGLVCHTGQVLYPPPSPPRTLIDHICSDLETVCGVETWSGDDGKKPRLSDHPGVVVTLTIPKRTQL
jgi:endonuclease/exonuclease/phosphatase family metal-dependent hydrolase